MARHYGRGLTFDCSRELLNMFLIVDSFGEVRVLHATKRTPTPMNEITSIVPATTIGRIERALRVFVINQVATDRISSTDAVGVLGGRVYSVPVFNAMRTVHAVKMLDVLKNRLVWLQCEPWQSPAPLPWLECSTSHERVASLMKQVRLFSVYASVLTFCNKCYVDSDAMAAALSVVRSLQTERNVFILPPAASSARASSKPSYESVRRFKRSRGSHRQVAARQFGLSRSISATPTAGPASLMISTPTKPSTSILCSPKTRTRLQESGCACHWRLFSQCRSRPSHRRFRGVSQRDNYNCGVLTLLFFECFVTGASAMTLEACLHASLLRHARYWYLALSLEALFM